MSVVSVSEAKENPALFFNINQGKASKIKSIKMLLLFSKKYA